MPISRPFLIALISAMMVGGAFFASRGLSGSSTEGDSGPVAPAPESKAVTPVPKAEGPVTKEARQALRGGPTVKSGTFNLHVVGRQLDLTANGKFQSQGLAKMPLFDIELMGKAGGRDVGLGAVSTGESAYLERGDQALVLQPQGWSALTRARTQQARQRPNRQSFNGYTKKELASFEFQGQETLDGARVFHFRGNIDRADARHDFDEFAGLFKKTSLDSSLPGVLARSISGGKLDFWVGEDHIVRRELYRYESPAGPFQLDYKRGAINQPQQITAPAGAIRKTPLQAGWDRDSFGLAFSALTIGVLTVEPGGGNSDKPAPPAHEPARPAHEPTRKAHEPARKAHRAPRHPHARRHAGTSPAAVKRAVGSHRIVVMFFRQRGADDDAVANAIGSIRGRSGVSVFTIPVGQAPKYAKVGAGSVVRAPTVVLIGHDREPRLFEGFIDSATLAQAVTDAR